MSTPSDGSSAFGSCCDAMKEVLESKEFDPLLAVAEDGVLYMSIGMLEADDGAANVIDHPIFFCPFCGTQVQTEEQVEAKTGEHGES
jgi:hypothetical protein